MLQCIGFVGIECQVVSRTSFSHESVKDVDIVFSAGGDGTFLLGASMIKTPDLPLIGVNTDPERFFIDFF